jgi:hypothetical protein
MRSLFEIFDFAVLSEEFRYMDRFRP